MYGIPIINRTLFYYSKAQWCIPVLYSCMLLFHCGVLLTVFTDGVLKPSSLNFPFNLVAVFPIKPLRTWLRQVLSSIITQISTCNNYICININETFVTSYPSILYWWNFSYAIIKWSTNFEVIELISMFIYNICA